MKRTVTMREFEAFEKANSELAAAITGLPQTTKTALTVRDGALAQGDADSALSVVMMGATVIVDGAERCFKDFERATANFLGESLRPGEALADFHQRIVRLICDADDSNASVRAILEVQKRNGITFDLSA